MAKLEILVYPDERLRQVSQPVKAIDNKIVSFISDLEETLSCLPGCVGIAAPQVGLLNALLLSIFLPDRNTSTMVIWFL